MGTMKGFNDYVKNRKERLSKLESKIGFDMNDSLQEAYKVNYTPTGLKNDITHFLTRRDSAEAEAERVANLAKKNEGTLVDYLNKNASGWENTTNEKQKQELYNITNS